MSRKGSTNLKNRGKTRRDFGTIGETHKQEHTKRDKGAFKYREPSRRTVLPYDEEKTG